MDLAMTAEGWSGSPDALTISETGLRQTNRRDTSGRVVSIFLFEANEGDAEAGDCLAERVTGCAFAVANTLEIRHMSTNG